MWSRIGTPTNVRGLRRAPNFGITLTIGEMGDLPHLVPALAAEGVEIPRADDYPDLVFLQLPAAEQGAPSGVLDMSLDDIHERALDLGTRDAAREHAERRLEAFTAAAYAEWATWLRDNVEDVSAHLSGLFDEALATLRFLAAAGITPTATADEVIHRGPELIAAWSRAADDLPRIKHLAELRFALAIWTDTAPVNHPLKWRFGRGRHSIGGRIDYTTTILGGRPDDLPGNARSSEGLREFLARNAHRLRMVGPAEIEAAWIADHGDAEPAVASVVGWSIEYDRDADRYNRVRRDANVDQSTATTPGALPAGI